MDLYRKSLINESLTNIFLEDIYGNKAVVYHRTRIEDLINKIYTEGFKPGGGDTYGKGFYGTYELDSQLRPKMKEKYGDIIVKFTINSLNRFMFFDYDEFLKSPTAKKIKTTKDNFIIDQLEYFDLKRHIRTKDEEILELQKKTKYSSVIVLDVFNNSNIFSKILDGIIFTGETDGKVLVSYNSDLIVPVSYSDDESKTWKKVNKNQDFLKKVFNQNIDILKTKIISKEIKKHLDDYPELLNKQTSKDSIFQINLISNGKIYIKWRAGNWKNGVWEDGEWDNGYWEDGQWMNGIWKYGTWWNGTWHDGTWLHGTWLKGTWKNGEWKRGTWVKGTWENGIWKNGTWENGKWEKGKWLKGTWKDGEWYNGEWLNGTWEKGTWKDGEWYNGEWLNGTWERGYWEDGSWYNGTWNFGYWVSGQWHDGIWEEGIWRDGFWYDGKWEDGEWLNGVWQGGTWYNGTWKGGEWIDGIWKGGEWLGGTWEGGTWLGGYDKDGKYHRKGNSPDKWG